MWERCVCVCCVVVVCVCVCVLMSNTMRSLLMLMTSTAKSRLKASSDSELSTPYAAYASDDSVADTYNLSQQRRRQVSRGEGGGIVQGEHAGAVRRVGGRWKPTEG